MSRWLPGSPEIQNRASQIVALLQNVSLKERREVGIRFTHHAPIGSDGSAEDTKLRHNYLWFGESNGYPSRHIYSAGAPGSEGSWASRA